MKNFITLILFLTFGMTIKCVAQENTRPSDPLTSEKSKDDYEISPFIKSIATGNSIPTDLDYKNEYADYLTKKYK